MANQEQLDFIKRGVNTWNAWRKAEGTGVVDLSYANLRNASLPKALLGNAIIVCSDLSGADLRKAGLMNSNLEKTSLRSSNLVEARLMGASLGETNLSEANLKNADMRRVNLSHTILNNTQLQGTQLENAILNRTTFSDCDLSEVRDLDEVGHFAPSFVDHKTLMKSGPLPESFLIGCGLSDWEIEHAKLYQPALSNAEINDIVYRLFDIRATQSIQINPMFISYSHADKDFVDALGALLTEQGVRYWRDTKDMKAGRMEKQVDQAMRLNDLVLIILSSASVKSDWVELEVEKARVIEKEHDKDVLCPITLDDAWRSSKWDERIRRQIQKYNILDFSDWKDEDVLKKKFADLITGIDLFYR